jgi:hypothetical protein
MKKDHPYRSQPAKAFWRQTVSEPHFLSITDWYEKKWPITDARISAAGSCFAQHLGRYLRNSGFDFQDFERPPVGLKPERWLDYGYNMYSARYGNVYSPMQLLQLMQRASGTFQPQETAWEHKGGVVDPFRPTIEPDPFGSVKELEACRESHLAAVSQLFRQTDLFVFTLGLTEAWRSKTDGSVYPVCPGTNGGAFDDSRYEFVNFNYKDTVGALKQFIKLARDINKDMRFLLTVSPVPLVATATTKQVLVASSYSKAVLRAAAGFLADTYDFIDYFPSYEIISSHVMRGTFYKPDLRDVMDAGVEHVMKQFFSVHVPPQKAEQKAPVPANTEDEDDVMCDEILLEAFGDGKR